MPRRGHARRQRHPYLLRGELRLQGVSLEVKEGQIVALLGRNGMGKTTTIRSIIGFNPPRRGEVLYKEKNLAGRRPFEISRVRYRLGPPRPSHLPLAVRARESHGQRPLPWQVQPLDARPGVRDVPHSQGEGQEPGDRTERRRAADAGHRAGAYDQRRASPHGRALRGSCAPSCPRDRRPDLDPQTGRSVHPPRGAERHHGHQGRRLRVRDQQRPDRVRWGRPGVQGPTARCRNSSSEYRWPAAVFPGGAQSAGRRIKVKEQVSWRQQYQESQTPSGSTTWSRTTGLYRRPSPNSPSSTVSSPCSRSSLFTTSPCSTCWRRSSAPRRPCNLYAKIWERRTDLELPGLRAAVGLKPEDPMTMDKFAELMEIYFDTFGNPIYLAEKSEDRYTFRVTDCPYTTEILWKMYLARGEPGLQRQDPGVVQHGYLRQVPATSPAWRRTGPSVSRRSCAVAASTASSPSCASTSRSGRQWSRSIRNEAHDSRQGTPRDP